MGRVFGRQGYSVSQVFDLIVHRNIFHSMHSMVTECDVADLLDSYRIALCFPSRFEDPYEADVFLSKSQSVVFNDIDEIVTNMEPPPRLKVDYFTHMLMEFARQHDVDYQDMLLANFLKLVNTNAMYAGVKDDCLPYLYDEKATHEDVDSALKGLVLKLLIIQRERVKEQLLTVVKPLDLLWEFNHVSISHHVYEIIEVAELRRSALGSRFINKNHFIWALYECGYGLPPNLKKAIELTDDDYPPYHIYATSLDLAECFDEKKLRLEHFVFAVLYSKDIVDKGKQMLEIQKDFEDFLNVVALDSTEMPKVRRQSQTKQKPCFMANDENGSSLKEMKKVLESGKLDTFIEEISLMLIA